MPNSNRPIQFRDYLPEVFQEDWEKSFLKYFLKAFEALFEELEVAFDSIPSLFDPDKTPPPPFAHNLEPLDYEYLKYLASWIGLPLRDEKPLEWNREFFKTAISLYGKRSTLPGMCDLLRAWLKDDLFETEKKCIILTDLTRKHTDADTVFQVGVTATLGVDTMLGEGPPFFFIADLITDPKVTELRNPAGVDGFQRATRFLIDSEKPAYTYYQLRIRAHTMRLLPQGQTMIDEQPGAQIGVTTLLWDKPWIST